MAEKIQERWTRGLKTTEEKAKRRDLVLGSAHIFEALRSILEAELKENRRLQEAEKMYEIPNWEVYQADRIGVNRTLSNIISLITIKERPS